MEQWLSSMLRSHGGLFSGKDLFLDVGAYHGDMSSLMLESGVFSEGILFEPNPDNIGVLRQRFAGEPRMTLRENACGDKSGTVPMYCTDRAYTGSLLPYSEGVEGARHFEVELARLDDKLDASQHSRVGLLKIDTQGNDLRVLMGAAKLLEEAQPWIVVELIYGDLYEGQCSPTEICAHLGQLGYVKAAELNEFFDEDGILGWSDACFIPRGHVASERSGWRPRRTAGDIRDEFKRRPVRTLRRLIKGSSKI